MYIHFAVTSHEKERDVIKVDHMLIICFKNRAIGL